MSEREIWEPLRGRELPAALVRDLFADPEPRYVRREARLDPLLLLLPVPARFRSARRRQRRASGSWRDRRLARIAAAPKPRLGG
jgi:hypothetical protein